MIRIYTKTRHIAKIKNFLDSSNIESEIYTINDNPPDTPFDLGVSYCYPRKITEPLLSIPKNGFVNYHPAPLPKYPGITELDDAIKNKEMHWGVTAHYMDKNYDTGQIVRIKEIELHEPPTSPNELGAISHYYLFQLFKETIIEMTKKYKLGEEGFWYDGDWRQMPWIKPQIEDGKLTRFNYIVQYPENLKTGINFDIGSFTYINCKFGVEIQDYVQIGSHCSIYSHSTIDQEKGTVLLKKNCRIGSHSTVMPNVTIGENSMIGAYSFVNHDIPANEIWVGVPAKFEKKIS